MLEGLRASGNGDAAHASLEVLTQIARALGLQGKFAEGHAILDTVDQLLRAAAPTASRAHIRATIERGRLYNSAGDAATALPLFKHAWEAACAVSDAAPLALDAAHMVAIAAPPEEALQWSGMAIDLASRASDPAVRSWLGPLYNNTGWTLLEGGDAGRALELFDRGLQFRLECGWTRESVIALCAVARALRALGRLDDALARIEEAERRWRDLGFEPDGFTSEEHAECLFAMDRREESRPHFARAAALQSADQWLAAREPARIARLRELGAP